MNEQRLEAYSQLIASLLNCPDGEEPEILAANTELLDAGFVQVLAAVADDFAQQREENTANWLRNLATYLSQESAPITEDDIETYGRFLLEILQATADSNGDPQVIYPLLAANTDKLDRIFAELLRRWATNTLAEAKPDAATSIAAVIGNFSNLIQQFPLGSKANNMEIAIAGYEIILTVYTRNAFPKQWATLQNNLAAAYSNRIIGERADNLEQAIAAYRAALEVYTRNAFPEQWATTQNNLGNAYSNRIIGERADNLEQAIAAYRAALEVRTRNAFPEQWATLQNNLGNAYSNRIIGERADNLDLAIAAYRAALEVRTRNAFPQNHAETLLNLGRLYQEEQQFDLAHNIFDSAIATVEALRGDIVSGDEAKLKQAEEWNQLYLRMVQVCLALGRDTEAIEYIERSKTRNLVELLTKAALATQANLPLVGSSIQFTEIQNLLDNETAIIQWYIFNDCFRAFIITRTNNPVIWQSQPQDLENLRKWTANYLQRYIENKNKWRSQLNHQLTQLTQILHLNQIVSLIPPHCQKLILIPHRYLHLLPFHAIPLSNNTSTREYLIDKFLGGVSYAPSCQLLRFAQIKAQQLNTSSQLSAASLSHLFAIQNPTNNLAFTDIEVETIAADFQPHQILKHHQATKAALAEQANNKNLRNSQWLHFSCHGYFDFNSPLKSGLQLAAATIANIPANTNSSRYLRIDEGTIIDLDKCLTLEDILQLNLPNCRLVTLSACETGIIDIRNNSDEYIGLTSGFIRAGAANIISTLWAVSDFHTALLMIKFYELLPNYSYNVPLALNHTQQELRQATQAQIIDWIRDKEKMELAQKQQIIDILETQYKPEQQPFKKPEFWAAFCAISPC
ncbi:MAG: CHAT domain-containing protein [Aulosira sp. DedVER01a]